MTFGETMHRHIASGMSAPQAMKATWKDVHAGKAQRPPHRRAGTRSTVGRFIRHGEKGKIDRRDDEGHFLRRNWSGFGAINPRHRARRRSGGGGKGGGGGWLKPVLLIGGGFLLLKSGGLGTMFGGGTAAPLGQAPAGMYWDPYTRTYRAIPATGIPAYAQQVLTTPGVQNAISNALGSLISGFTGLFTGPTASSPVATAGPVALDAMYADFLAAQSAVGAPTAWDSLWYRPPVVDVTDPLATGGPSGIMTVDPFAAVGIAQGAPFPYGIPPVLSQDLSLAPVNDPWNPDPSVIDEWAWGAEPVAWF